MSHRVRILSISDDDGLRFSRELLLKSEGYETESMTSNAALCHPVGGQIDIALICRSVDNERATAITNALRRDHPEVHVVCVAPRQNDPESRDEDLDVSPEPEPLLEAIQLLCNQMTATQRMGEDFTSMRRKLQSCN